MYRNPYTAHGHRRPAKAATDSHLVDEVRYRPNVPGSTRATAPSTLARVAT